MKYEVKEIITVNQKQYIIIAKTNLEGNDYIFTNELKNDEEVTENYIIFKIENNKAINLENEEIANKLLPIFQEILKKQLEELMKGGL